MQFVDLKTQYHSIKNNVDKAINSVLNHGRYVMGPEIDQLESELASFIGAKYSVAVSSGTDALLLSLMALDIQPDDEIITSPFSFFATAEVIALLRAKPVFVDIEADTFNIDATKIEAAITKKTKAIMPVSLYGQCADMDAINRIAQRHDIAVIEDGAQSFGARYKTGHSCNLSSIGCTSFFPSKPLGCYGDGGACFTNDDTVYQKLKSLRDHGQQGRYHHVYLGTNSRMSSIQAAVLIEKLKIFPHEIEMRQYHASQYDKQLRDVVKTPKIEPENTSTYAQYTIAVDDRASLIGYLDQHAIPTAIHYPQPIHLQPAMNYLDYQCGDFPISESLSQKVLSLPMHPYLSDDEVSQVCRSIAAWAS